MGSVLQQIAPGFGTAGRRRARAVFLALSAAAVNLAVQLPAVAASTDLAVERVAGADRYETAAALAERGWPDGATRVYLAAGGRFADALAAGPAAAKADGPILLTGSTALPEATDSALQRLDPAEVVVVGGPGAVATSVLDEISSRTAARVRRIGGIDRYATAAAVASAGWPAGAETVYLAAGDRFADALAAGPLAGRDGAPILLTSPDRLPEPTVAALRFLAPDRVVVIGGPGAVSQAVLDTVGAGRAVERISGADRYETAAAVAERLSGTVPASAYVATGVAYPDALAAAPVAARAGAPVLLSTPSCLPEPLVAALDRTAPTGLVLLGGELALGSGVLGLTPCASVTAERSCGGNAATLTITGPQTERTRLTGLPAGTHIDAATAVWEHVHDWPVHVEADRGLCFRGGSIRGAYPDDTTWDELHSTGAFNLFAPSATVEDLRIHNYGDGIRVLDGASDFTITRAHLSYVRDDCVENDDLHGGLVDDSLLDGCYVAFSARAWQDEHTYDGSGQTWTLRGNLVRLQPMPTVYDGPAPGHGGFFKWGPLAPSISLHGNVFRADQDSNHTTMGIPEGALADCSDNTMVWLGEGPYPAPLPECFTVTTDRRVWDDAVAAWHARG